MLQPYFGVVLLDEDEPVPDVPLDDAEPVPEPLVLPEGLVLDELLLGLVLDELLPGLLMLPDELLGLVLDELLLEGVELVSVLDDELDEAGGVAGVTVVLLLLLLGGVDGAGVTTVLSFFSHPATLMPRATANALNIMILDFMGTPFKLCSGRNERQPPSFPATHSQVRCHAAEAAHGAAHPPLRAPCGMLALRHDQRPGKYFRYVVSIAPARSADGKKAQEIQVFRRPVHNGNGVCKPMKQECGRVQDAPTRYHVRRPRNSALPIIVLQWS